MNKEQEQLIVDLQEYFKGNVVARNALAAEQLIKALDVVSVLLEDKIIVD